ncbi:MAG: 50S ribosomal protein L19 [bacterium]|nr:50S ribosomal protein L19 [bacterium]
MSQQLIDAVEQKYTKRKLPEFHVGDTVDVKLRIREGGRERAQIFNGVVIARGGKGISETFTVRRIVNNEGVERVLMLHSPLVSDVAVKRRGKVRRAKLYYLRDRIGKARRVRELRVSKHKGAKTDAASAAPPANEPEVEEPEPAAVGS